MLAVQPGLLHALRLYHFDFIDTFLMLLISLPLGTKDLETALAKLEVLCQRLVSN